MAQDIEKAVSRLQNIEAVEPILGALRTISLGNRQMAINNRRDIMRYNDQILDLLPHILPAVQKKLDFSQDRHLHPNDGDGAINRILVVGIGTERGLCGRYNVILAEYIASLVSEYTGNGQDVTLGIMGSRLLRSVSRSELSPNWTLKMPVNSLPTFNTSYRQVLQWLEDFEADAIHQVIVVYNKQQKAGSYQPFSTQLIPLTPPSLPSSESWPPYIIDTDPIDMYVQIIMQWTSIQFYSFMLEAAITEHTARYQLMESASQNAQRLIEELTISIQSTRRQQITRELQELAIGAGLIG